MKQRRRIYYSAAQQAEIWDRWRRVDSMHDIGRLFDRHRRSRAPAKIRYETLLALPRFQ